MIIKISIIPDVNDTYYWLLNTVQWAVENCSSFYCEKSLDEAAALEPYIVRDYTNSHYKFAFDDNNEATLFLLKWA